MFNEKSFADATETAWARNRLCLVYIAAEKGGGSKAAKVDDAICKALADPEVGGVAAAGPTGGVFYPNPNRSEVALLCQLVE